MAMALPPGTGKRTQSPAMIRRPRPNEIKLLPQIENEVDLRYARVG
jgi:hypothetical protein